MTNRKLFKRPFCRFYKKEVASLSASWKLENLNSLNFSPSSIVRDYKNISKKIRNCKNRNISWRCVKLDKPFLKTACHYYFNFSSVSENQVNLFYQGRMPWLCRTLPLNSRMSSDNSRTFSRITIKRACIQVMMRIKDKRSMFC